MVVGIDEAQFFDQGLVEVVARLAAAGKKVIVAGLDLDYLGRPFEPIPTLMTRAEYVTKSLAVCHRCGGAGMFTQRVIQSDELVVLGRRGGLRGPLPPLLRPQRGPAGELDIERGALDARRPGLLPVWDLPLYPHPGRRQLSAATSAGTRNRYTTRSPIAECPW